MSTMKMDDTSITEASTSSSTYQKHHSYVLSVDPSQNDKATGFRLRHMKRPHMRAFWMSNFCQRACHLLWFSLNPMLYVVQQSLGIEDRKIWESIIASLAGSFVSRLIAGFVCDKYGARLPFAALLVFSCIPTLCLGLVKTALELIIVRFFVGFAGGAFVMCHFWIESMFTHDNSGFVHGFTGGIGMVNGAANISIGAIAFPFFQYVTGSRELGWRLSFIVPCGYALFFAILTIYFSDDTPRGNYSKLKKENLVKPVSSMSSITSAIKDRNVWIFGIQYAFNFGVEIILYNTIVKDLQEKALLSEKNSIIVAGLSSASNQILRAFAGRLSDRIFIQGGLLARIRIQVLFVCLSGFFLFPYAMAQKSAAIVASLFAIMFFLSAAQGVTFSLVPLFGMEYGGCAIGMVGAIGNLGAVIFSVMFLYIDFNYALMIMGILIMLSGTLSSFILFPEDREGGVAMTCFNEEKIDSDEASNTCLGESIRDGWLVHFDSVCEICSFPLMSETAETLPICLVCKENEDTAEEDKVNVVENLKTETNLSDKSSGWV